MKKIQVKIESMAFKGYGVARVDGKLIFIPHSVIGDEGWVEVTEEKKDYAIGSLKKTIIPSPWRVDPPCPYFHWCGGCQWQHITDSIQGELKKDILREILKRLGGLKEMPNITTVLSPDPYGYRTRIQLKVKGEALGYFQKSSHHVVDIDHCSISHLLVNQIILFLRKEFHLYPRMGEIEINVSPEEGKGVLILHPLSIRQGRADGIINVTHLHPIVKGFALKKKGRLEGFGDPYLNFTVRLDRYGGKRDLLFRTSPGSFFQINLKQNQTLIETVLSFSDVREEERVLDLYAGVGNFALPLAIGSKKVLGIEEKKGAVEDGWFNAERNGIKNCDFIHGRVEDVLNHVGRKRPDLIILDPPRMGCKMIVNQLVRLKPKRMVYISCDPTTFARDLRLFSKSGYLLQRLALIDMFPQTYHMEVVGLLKLLC
jgi:23S rRNA (uracil1939-C5)-methyltransferase